MLPLNVFSLGQDLFASNRDGSQWRQQPVQ